MKFVEKHQPRQVVSVVEIPSKKFSQLAVDIFDLTGQFKGKLYLNGNGSIKLISHELKFGDPKEPLCKV